MAIAGFDVHAQLPPLKPAEIDFVAHAVEKRQREFHAGRAAASKAMAALGYPDHAVPIGPNRAPHWPEGVTGSITHSSGFALAAVAPSSACRALGIDLEDDAPLPPEMLRLVMTSRERAAAAGSADLGALGKRSFVAKECAYKAQFPLTADVFSFNALELAFDGACFVATRVDGAWADLPLVGRDDAVAGLRVAAMVVP
ncbi:MAG: 4'-phosphopantetheinyl transferase superfamily protein [Pseudomonadota bacterium]